MHRVNDDTNYILIYDVHMKEMSFKTQSKYTSFDTEQF